MVKNNIKAVALTSFNTAGAGAAYLAINAAGLDEACFNLKIHNASNIAITISYDGVNDHDYLPAGQTILFDFQTNSQPKNYVANFAKGTVVYVASVTGAAGAGLVYLSGYYQARV